VEEETTGLRKIVPRVLQLYLLKHVISILRKKETLTDSCVV